MKLTPRIYVQVRLPEPSSEAILRHRRNAGNNHSEWSPLLGHNYDIGPRGPSSPVEGQTSVVVEVLEMVVVTAHVGEVRVEVKVYSVTLTDHEGVNEESEVDDGGPVEMFSDVELSSSALLTVDLHRQ